LSIVRLFEATLAMKRQILKEIVYN